MYEINFTVRDYECDLQGIVNNAVYLNYLEHARHRFLKEIGFDFAQMHKEGIDAVAVRIEIDYKLALVSGDEFIIKTAIQRAGRLKLVFLQEIYRLNDKKTVASAKTYAVCIKNSKPVLPQDILKAVQSKYPYFE